MCLEIKYCKKKNGFDVPKSKPVNGYKIMVRFKDKGTLIPKFSHDQYKVNVEYEAEPNGEILIQDNAIGKSAFHYYTTKKQAENDYKEYIRKKKKIEKNKPDYFGKNLLISLVKCEFWGQSYKESKNLKHTADNPVTSCSKYMKIIEIIDEA